MQVRKKDKRERHCLVADIFTCQTKGVTNNINYRAPGTRVVHSGSLPWLTRKATVNVAERHHEYKESHVLCKSKCLCAFFVNMEISDTYML